MINSLLVPVDGSALSERAMDESIALGRQMGVAIVGFVVEPEVPSTSATARFVRYGQEPGTDAGHVESQARAVLAEFGRRAAAAGVAFSARHERTDRIDEAIARAAGEIDGVMIVMVTHGRGSFGELLFGSHTKQVMARTRAPLLVLH
jgi:nucleotide-binding universal stress UspA family protein